MGQNFDYTDYIEKLFAYTLHIAINTMVDWRCFNRSPLLLPKLTERDLDTV